MGNGTELTRALWPVCFLLVKRFCLYIVPLEGRDASDPGQSQSRENEFLFLCFRVNQARRVRKVTKALM